MARTIDKYIIEVKTKGARRSADSLSKVSKGSRGMGIAMGFAKGAVLGLGAALVATAVHSVKTASQFEQLQVRLNAMYGSVQKGTRAFNEFQKIAASTPYSVQAVVEAGAQLKAFGMDAEENIKGIADLAAFMGTDVVEAANAMGRAFAGGAGAADVLRERGILNLLKEFKGIDDVTKLTLPEFRDALQEMISDPSAGIAGSTDALSETFSGSYSNMMDSVDRLAASIGDKLIPIMNTVADWIGETADEWSGATSAAYEQMIQLEANMYTMEALVHTLHDTAEGTDEWNRQIRFIKREYPEFLQHLEDEEINHKNINKLLDDYNNLTEKRIEIQGIAMELETWEKKKKDIVQENTDAYIDFGRTMATTQDAIIAQISAMTEWQVMDADLRSALQTTNQELGKWSYDLNLFSLAYETGAENVHLFKQIMEEDVNPKLLKEWKKHYPKIEEWLEDGVIDIEEFAKASDISFRRAGEASEDYIRIITRSVSSANNVFTNLLDSAWVPDSVTSAKIGLEALDVKDLVEEASNSFKKFEKSSGSVGGELAVVNRKIDELKDKLQGLKDEEDALLITDPEGVSVADEETLRELERLEEEKQKIIDDAAKEKAEKEKKNLEILNSLQQDYSNKRLQVDKNTMDLDMKMLSDSIKKQKSVIGINEIENLELREKFRKDEIELLNKQQAREEDALNKQQDAIEQALIDQMLFQAEHYDLSEKEQENYLKELDALQEAHIKQDEELQRIQNQADEQLLLEHKNNEHDIRTGKEEETQRALEEIAREGASNRLDFEKEFNNRQDQLLQDRIDRIKGYGVQTIMTLSTTQDLEDAQQLAYYNNARAEMILHYELMQETQKAARDAEFALAGDDSEKKSEIQKTYNQMFLDNEAAYKASLKALNLEHAEWERQLDVYRLMEQTQHMLDWGHTMVGGFQSALQSGMKMSKKQKIALAEADKVMVILQGLKEISGIWASPPYGPFAIAAKTAMSVAAGVRTAGQVSGIQEQISQLRGMEDTLNISGEKAAVGYSGVISKPTNLLVGEAGSEMVNVTPLDGRASKGMGAVNIHISGNVMSKDFVENELAEKIREALRKGVDFGV